MEKATDIDRGAQTARKRIVDLLARATLAELQDALTAFDPAPVYTALRGPETGLVMVKGRIGGGGAPFNLGEATVSRASIRLSDGRIGHGAGQGDISYLQAHARAGGASRLYVVVCGSLLA